MLPCRGGRSGKFEVEACDVQGHLILHKHLSRIPALATASSAMLSSVVAMPIGNTYNEY